MFTLNGAVRPYCERHNWDQFCPQNAIIYRLVTLNLEQVTTDKIHEINYRILFPSPLLYHQSITDCKYTLPYIVR